MRTFRLAIILAVMGLATLPAASQTSGTTSGTLRILAPKSGERLQQSFVTVQYELANPGAAAGSPNYWLQLDNREPVVTTATEHSFTGLASGRHTLVVRLVDANNTPISGMEAQLEFAVAPPAPAPRAALPQSDGPVVDDPAPLPAAGSALPLLSVIGFGALVGGIASALKTR